MWFLHVESDQIIKYSGILKFLKSMGKEELTEVLLLLLSQEFCSSNKIHLTAHFSAERILLISVEFKIIDPFITVILYIVKCHYQARCFSSSRF